MSTPILELDGLQRDTWSAEEAADVALVADFVRLLMNEHAFDELRKRFDAGAYRQHNHGIADGLDGVISTVGDLVKRFPEYSYDVKTITADGDLVTFHSHATLRAAHRGDDRKGFNIIDRWRVVDGQIVEHWDAVQPIDRFGRLYALLTGGRVRNSNGTY